MTSDLTGRRIVVTGGASGIGAAIVDACAAAGAHVAVFDRNPPRQDVHHFAVDVGDAEAVTAGFAAAVPAIGGLDGVVHAAGIFDSGPAHSLADEAIGRIIAVNLIGTINVNLATFAHLKEQGGHILNFGSAAGIRGQRRAAHYAASKGGVGAWSRTIATEWARHNIRVNVVAPAMQSGMNDGLLDRLSSEQRAAYVERMQASIPLGGWFGEPARDLAPFVKFLMGDGSRFMTGQTFSVDGGAVMLAA